MKQSVFLSIGTLVCTSLASCSGEEFEVADAVGKPGFEAPTLSSAIPEVDITKAAQNLIEQQQATGKPDGKADQGSMVTSQESTTFMVPAYKVPKASSFAVRSGPGMTYPVVGYVSAGQMVFEYARVGGWKQIDQSQSLWVAGKNLSYRGPILVTGKVTSPMLPSGLGKGTQSAYYYKGNFYAGKSPYFLGKGNLPSSFVASDSYKNAAPYSSSFYKTSSMQPQALTIGSGSCTKTYHTALFQALASCDGAKVKTITKACSELAGVAAAGWQGCQ